MGLFSRLAGSADLVTGMADRLGADLAGPTLRDAERAAVEHRAMVLRCSACTDQPGCADLQAGSDHLDRAPDYCMNKDILDPHRD